MSLLAERLGQLLGSGDNAKVYQCTRNDDVAIKVIAYASEKQLADLRTELQIGKTMGELGVSPKVFEEEVDTHTCTFYYSMQKVQPLALTGKCYSTKAYTPAKIESIHRQVLRLIVKMIRAGYIHNDVHHGNIARSGGTADDDDVVLLDHGYTVYDPLLLCPSAKLYRAMALQAMCYQMLEHCPWRRNYASPLYEMIYEVRRGGHEEVEAELQDIALHVLYRDVRSMNGSSNSL